MATSPHVGTGTEGKKAGTSLGIPWEALLPKAAYQKSAALHLRCVQLWRWARQGVPRMGKMWEGQEG